MKNKIIANFQGLALEWLGVVFPFIPPIKMSKDFFNNLSNAILLSKIRHFIENQDSDFDDWLKSSCDFQKDSARYYETVKHLIYTIDSINDDAKIHIYANLMRAYKLDFINKNTFLKLSSVLPVIFYGDLVFLKEKTNREINEVIEDGEYFSVVYANLLSHGLVYCTTKYNWTDTEESEKYRITKLGTEMIRCGIDLDNHDKYKNAQDKYEHSDLVISGGKF